MLQFLVGMILSAVITLIVYSAYIVIIAFTLWMAIDAAKQDRFWWIVLIIGVPVVGSVCYFYTEKKHEYAKAPSRHVHESQTEIEHEVTPKPRKNRRKVEHTESVPVDGDSKNDVIPTEQNS